MAIEFAAIALPLMLLLGGSIEVSRYVWTRLALQDAASVGARCLGLQLDPCFGTKTMDLDGTVGFVRKQAAAWTIDLSEDSVTVEDDATCHDVDDFVKIAIRHRFVDVISILPEAWIDVAACFPVMSPE